MLHSSTLITRPPKLPSIPKLRITLNEGVSGVDAVAGMAEVAGEVAATVADRTMAAVAAGIPQTEGSNSSVQGVLQARDLRLLLGRMVGFKWASPLMG